MPFFIVNINGIYPMEYTTYAQACADCEGGEYVYISDSIEVLEECLEARAYQEEGYVDTI